MTSLRLDPKLGVFLVRRSWYTSLVRWVFSLDLHWEEEVACKRREYQGHLQPIYLSIYLCRLGCSLDELPLCGLTNFIRPNTWITRRRKKLDGVGPVDNIPFPDYLNHLSK